MVGFGEVGVVAVLEGEISRMGVVARARARVRVMRVRVGKEEEKGVFMILGIGWIVI